MNIITFNAQSVRFFGTHIIILLVISFWQNVCYGQQQGNSSAKGLTFSEIKIEDEAKDEFKTLEIRYKNFTETTLNSLKIDGEDYKCFNNKKSAIKYYYLVKKDSPSLVVYYVFSPIPKPAEIYTFRITP